MLDESQHQFKVSGLDVVAVGIKQTTGVGDVYHVKNLKVQAAVSYELAEEIPLVK